MQISKHRASAIFCQPYSFRMTIFVTGRGKNCPTAENCRGKGKKNGEPKLPVL
jgi:hypothetical protein